MTAFLKTCDMLADDGSTTTLATAGCNVRYLHVVNKERERLTAQIRRLSLY